MKQSEYAVIRMYDYHREDDLFHKEGEVGRYSSAKLAIFWLGVRERSFGLRVEGYDDDAGRAVFGVRLSGELGDEFWCVRKVISTPA